MTDSVAPRRARRVWGAVALALVAAAAAWVAFGERPDAEAEAVRRGIGHVLAAAGGGDAARLGEARAAFRDALRAAPLDPYPAFLLQLAERLESPATLDPDGGPYERALGLVSEGRLDEAHLLLVRQGRADGGAESYLLRFLRDAAAVRGAAAPER